MDFESQKKVTNYIGNSNLFELIITKLNNKTLHNSILLYGNQGIGKSTFVYYLAKNYFSKNRAPVTDHKNRASVHHKNKNLV